MHLWQKHYADAETVYIRALHISQVRLGRDDIETTYIEGRLGSVYFGEKRYAEACRQCSKLRSPN